MEIDDEDVVIHGTDLHTYLNTVGHSEFEVSEPRDVEKRRPPEGRHPKEQKGSGMIYSPIQKYTKDFELCLTLVKTIIKSQLMFKEDTLFVKEFIPSNYIVYPLFCTKRNSITLFILCVFCGLLNIFFAEYCDEWMTLSILILWFGYIFIEIMYNLNQNRKIKTIVLKTIKCMEKSSLLIQKTAHFLQECNNLHSIYNSCGDTFMNRSTNAFMYLMMPELKVLLLTVLKDLINSLVYNISDIHTFFPLKDSMSNITYLYLTDYKIDFQDTSIENINKTKYTYFLLQSEFLKQSALCLCPILWTPKSFSQMNRLIVTIGKIEKIYSNSYYVLSEEYNIYSLFKNNSIEYTKLSSNDTYVNSDLKSKVYSVRQLLQNMMVHVRFMEDSLNNSNYCSDDINNTLNALIKEVSIFNELVSNLQIYILKTTNNCHKKDNTILMDDQSTVEGQTDTVINKPIKEVCEDELFFGISEELSTEVTDSILCNEEVFDKSNNRNLMLELKMALKDKQEEWKYRECKLLQKHPQLNDLNNAEENNEKQQNDEYINKVRKVALNLAPNETFPMQLPDKCFANEIAMVACKWNTEIQSFGDDSDTDTSMEFTDS